MKIIKRDGTIVEYNPEKIKNAIKKANNDVGRKEKATNEEIEEIIKLFNITMLFLLSFNTLIEVKKIVMMNYYLKLFN